MSEVKFGTDHERYLGPGIVFLSQIAATAHSDYYLCKKEQKEIESQFQRGACEPWLPESRLKAEISRSQWETKNIMGTERLGRYDLPKLWFKDADIRIMGSVARLEAARSSGASVLKEMFNRLETEERWWVVDFFEHVNLQDEQVALDWKQEAVRSFFYPPTREWGATRSSDKSKLTTTIYEEAKLVSRTPGVADAFRGLSQLPDLWKTKAFTYLAYVRMSLCNEEVENYIWAIVDQWREITLNWDSMVVKCIDFTSINMLQSRAPSCSNEDLKFVRDGFQLQQILPQLKEPALRERVKAAICDQGPILTLETFAQDARLLQLRVRGSLKKLVTGMKRDKGDSLRKRICDILGREFDKISRASGLPIATDAQKQALVKRCYQHVFLHTIRTKESVNEVDLRIVVKQELYRLRIHEREPSLQSPVTDVGVIATQAPADDLPDIEVDMKKRHGHNLFECSTATKHLYYDRINDDSVSTLPLTTSFMAKHIVCIFLFGNTVSKRTQVPSPGLPTAIAQSAYTVANPTPSHISPISVCASDELGSSPNSPTCIATPTIQNVRSVRTEHAQARSAATKSIVAELVGAELPPANSTCTSNSVTTKRSASVAMLDTTQPVKRQLPEGWFGQGDLNVVVAETADPHYRRPSMVSPSVYSIDGRSLILQPDDGRFSVSIDPYQGGSKASSLAQDYIALLRECDPYSGRWNHDGSQPQAVVLSPPYPVQLTIGRRPPSKPRRRIPANEITQGPGFVLYKSVRGDKKFYRAPDTKDSTERFVAKQREHDRRSRFWYMQNGGKKHAATAAQLYQVIERSNATVVTVFVDSDSLGSV